jgi:hypothetical protein
LLGNANIKYDPDRHLTDKIRPVSIGVIDDPVYESEAKFVVICCGFMTVYTPIC